MSGIEAGYAERTSKAEVTKLKHLLTTLHGQIDPEGSLDHG
jgi:hypothetical protein